MLQWRMAIRFLETRKGQSDADIIIPGFHIREENELVSVLLLHS